MSQKYGMRLSKASFTALSILSSKKTWLLTEEKQDALVDLWNLSTNKIHRDMILALLYNYQYIGNQELNMYCTMITDQIIKIWQLTPNRTIIAAIADKEEIDGSHSILQNLKNYFCSFGNWGQMNFISTILDAAHKIQKSQNIVIVDDFIGTGTKATRRITYLRRKIAERNIENVRIYLCSVAAMQFAQNELNKLKIKYYSPLWLNKGISDYYKNTPKVDYLLARL